MILQAAPTRAELSLVDLFQGKKVFYVTNNSSNTRAKMVEKCHKLGFPAEKVGILESIIFFPQYVINKKNKQTNTHGLELLTLWL